MPPRRDKAEGSAPRKRALVSCDRCKLRRARCIRDNSDEPCADCRLAGVQCESKLPRKQRVYGSVETLSLRYRALESLVKGLFPQENVQDTNVVFAIALARNISMPDSDDFTPADIFHNSAQRPLPTQPTCIQEPLQSTLPVQQSRASHLAIDQSVRSTSTSSRASTSNTGQHNPFSKVQPTSRQAEELIQTRHGVPHYFGPSSSFRLAMTVRTLSARCKATQNTKSPRHHETDSGCSDAAGRLPIALRDTSTNPSDEEYTMPDQQRSRSPVRAQKERSRSKAGTTKDSWGDTNHISKSETFADFLPSRSLADALVSAYFDHVHMFLPLFHRSIFQYQLEATYKRQSELLKDCKDTGWLICLALVFAFGCEQLQEHDPDQAHALCLKYLGVTKTYFCKLVTTTSLVSIQALLLLNLHYQARGQKSTSWLLVGLAARMAITLGMHRGGSNCEFDPIERNTRRQVFWSIYVLEKILCSILGRPTVIDDAEMKMRLPDASMLEQQSMSAELLDITFEIAQMSYRIRQRAYFDPTTAEERSPALPVAISLLRECDNFHSRIPRYLLPDLNSSAPPSQRINVLLLHVYYYYTRCIVSRDFLIQKVERDISYLENKLPPISEDWDTTFALGEDCVESAYQSIRCIMAGQDFGLISYSHIDLFFVFHSVLIVCADFLARPGEQRVSHKDKERKEMVRAMLDHVRGMKTLAPTYITLNRIAVQFAAITGVYEEPVVPDDTPGQTSGPSPENHAGSGHDSIMSNVETLDFEEDWFASATTNLGLDFFDLNQLTGGLPLGAQSGGAAFPVYVQPMINQVDDWTARTLRGIHNFDK